MVCPKFLIYTSLLTGKYLQKELVAGLSASWCKGSRHVDFICFQQIGSHNKICWQCSCSCSYTSKTNVSFLSQYIRWHYATMTEQRWFARPDSSLNHSNARQVQQHARRCQYGSSITRPDEASWDRPPDLHPTLDMDSSQMLKDLKQMGLAALKLMASRMDGELGRYW